MVSYLRSLKKPTTSPSQQLLKPAISTIFFLYACLILFAAFLFRPSFAFAQCSIQPSRNLLNTPVNKLSHPVVILISSDGFRFGYQHKTPTPNIHRLISTGTEAETGLIPVYPTLTFPNHYSIVTGLYPANHGIVDNKFFDPNTNESFNQKTSSEPKWWLGEPLWETVVKQGFNASSYFWPGSEVKKPFWSCPKKFCPPYDSTVKFEDRVDTILSYFDLPADEIPALMTLYFEDPDYHGHRVGPDHPLITADVARIDAMVGRLIAGLEEKNIFEEVNVILVGDHGMVGTCDQRSIYLKELAPWIEIPRDWIQRYTPMLTIRPPADESPADIVAKMNEGLQSTYTGKYLKVYLKDKLPSRLHYSKSDRITPIVGLVDEGFKVEMNKPEAKQCAGSLKAETSKSDDRSCAGAHGYDNAIFSMRSIFIGHGPRFPKGVKVPSFENIQIYNLVTSILNIDGAPNDGDSNFPQTSQLKIIKDNGRSECNFC
ncbi:Ectonucleotide pyrophosphatase/phosphodiesterase family member 3 [Heracleum sosnowskyi]|uniref:Ectonucleotide pyrophosphatase/phosphodiesterase family member 3 n=1 Tax=Heracleum sosnowskyi TaxID=360622 RepID=A0AAD8GV74_9APIA|nr:Ectonucleotide pyrophosphatase/phosphodiesterase family member 3 [Heracleum sosnowskyi]